MPRLTRRQLGAAAAGMALGVGASGCRERRAAADGRTEVVFWHMWTGEWEAVVNRVVARFNESQSAIRVKPLVITGDANTKLLLALAGGAPPDLMAQWNQVIPAWAEKSALVALDTLMEPKEYARFREWLYPAARDIGTYKGHFYGLCMSLNAHGLLMNAGMMREAGLDPDHPPRTIAELDDYAKQMVKYDARGRIDRMGLLPLNLQHWAAVFGGEFYDPATERITANHPRIVEALEWMTTYSRRYDVNKVASFQAGLGQNVGDSWPFVKKKFAMIQDGQWRVEDMKKFAPDIDYRVTPLPYPSGGREKACHVNGNFLIIPRGAEHPKEALEFAKFWCGWGNEATGAEIATWGGWIPASPALTQAPAYRKYLAENPAFSTFLDVVASPNVRITPVMPVQAFLWDRLKATEEAALRLKVTPKEGLDYMTYEAQRELDKIKRRR